MPENNPYSERYARQIVLESFGAEAQAKLVNAKMLVIGCGGLGVPSALYLNAAGVGTIGLMDADRISLSNLHRQIIFRESDIGEKKVLRLAQYLKEQNSNTQINTIERYASGEQLLSTLEDYDLVIDCTDNFDSRYLINDACVLAAKPLVYGAVNGFEGQVAVFNVGQENRRSGHYRDLFPKAPEPGTVQNCEEAGVIGNLPGIIGTAMAGEAIKVVTGVGEALINKLWIFDGMNMGSHVIKYPSKNRPVERSLRNFQRSCAIFDVPTITWKELDKWDSQKQDYELVDVREINEHQMANVGGRNIPLSTINQHISEFEDLQKPLVFYCQSGQRSSRAVHDVQEDIESITAYSVVGGIKSR